MKKTASLILCAVLMLTLLSACQKEPEVPFVTNPGMQNNQQVTQPTQGGQQTTTPPTQPTQGGQQTTTPPTQPTQGGQQTTTPPTQPTQGGQQATTPTTQPTEPTEFVLPSPEECTYEQYMNMTGDQQEQFFNQFNGDFAAFFDWLDKAKAESDANSDDIVVGPDTTIDMDSIFGKQ